jgi:hypothetical protein
VVRQYVIHPLGPDSECNCSSGNGIRTHAN